MLAEVQDARDDIAPPAPARPRPEAAPTVMVPRYGADTTAQGQRYDADATVQGQRYDADATVHMARTEDRPQWARLPSARTETRAQPRPRRRAAAGSPDGDGRPGLRQRVLARPQGRLAVAGALAVLGLLVAIGGWWFGVGRFTTTPGLVAMQKSSAGRYDEKVPKDTVLAQTPPAGARIVSGGTITLTLSRGPERYSLPDESGKDADLAQNDLHQLKLTVQVVQVYDDVVPAGLVAGSDPAAQTEVRPGAKVVLKVSRGRAPVTVPSVINQPLDQAQGQLKGLGLNVAVKQQDSEKPANTVLNQDPADGSGVEKGATVTLTVSKGPPAVVVQDVTNHSADEARQLLAQQGLQATVIGAGTVRIQNPGAGSQVPPGTNIVLWCF
jgi:serine/threonine-protein kinase